MKGSFFLGADSEKKFEVREMTFGPLGADEVFIRNKACGVCGTDVHIYHGEGGSTDVVPPVVLGHEYSGIVEAVGEGVTQFKPGDHVAVDPNAYCGKCMPCRMGRKQNCEHLYALGVNANGGFAEYSVAPEAQVFLIKDDIPFEEAAMVEPLACVLHGIDRVGIEPGRTVLVIGGGPIGLLMVQMAKIAGASTVILSEPVEKRRQIGMEVGADAAIDPIHEDLSARIKEVTGRAGADIVIECVGRPFAAAQAVAAAGFSGKILLFSVPGPGATFELPLNDVFKKELTVYGSIINPDTHQRAVNLINSKRLELGKIITHKYDIEHVEEAIQMQMNSESIKVVVCS
ncbi:MAG: zinc-dependent alcohol dehydrogenase family protein [Dorea sp.]|nr:zinc-dependent alcohol dehydrogenase family protein [Dorea sp.]